MNSPIEREQNDWEPDEWAEHLGEGKWPEDQYHGVQLKSPAPANEYPTNWTQISAALKAKRRNTCERCKYVGLAGALHVHHLNRDKTNNDPSNLQVLCAMCHGDDHGTTLLTGTAPEDVAAMLDWRKNHQGWRVKK